MSPVSIEDLGAGKVARLFEGAEHGSSVSIFIVDAPPGTGPVLHRHPYEETFVVQEGAATFTVDGMDIEARGGEIVVAAAGAAHRFVNSGPGALRMVTVHPSDRVIQENLED
jgi:quercetin dioxygenase-like cupin family protein